MLEQLAAPVVLPVSLATAKSWARETSTDFDADYTDVLASAVEYVETICHNAVVYRPVREQFDAFLPMLELSGFPPRGVKSITYIDPSGVTQTLPAANYIVDVTKGQARITPGFQLYFPPTRPVMNAVQIVYDIGLICPISAVDTAGDTLTAPGANKKAGDVVQLETDGSAGSSVPVGLTATTAYYVVNPTNNGDTFQVASTPGGAALDITGAGTGPYFVGLLPKQVRQALRLLVNAWSNFPSDITTAAAKQLPVHGVEALLTPLMPRGF